jgi:hypothetical protein
MTVREEALSERARPRVVVTDDDEVLATHDRIDVGGGDLNVGAVEDRDRPRRPEVGESGSRPLADRRAIRVVEQLSPTPLELVVLGTEQERHLPQRREDSAEERGERAPPT